ncbi:MAG: peptidoglycan DD-metalloendopeptidase family protein [Gammaproteobacteria bacterium]
MTYRAYIKKDYKTIIRQEPDHPRMACFIRISIVAGLFVIPWLLSGMKAPVPVATQQSIPTSAVTSLQDQLIESSDISNDPATETAPLFENEAAGTDGIKPVLMENLNNTINEKPAKPAWQSVMVKRGDSLARIFQRLNLSARDLHTIMSLGSETLVLKRLQPGQILQFHSDKNQFKALKYGVDLATTIYVVKTDDGFHAEIQVEKLETHVKQANVVIEDSLFLSGVEAGLSDNMIMQLVAIYGWDIDFALDIRRDDRFSMIYEEQYKNGIKVKEGPILAAEFVNRDTPFRAVRYRHEDGHSDYYSETGHSMRKAFLRTPVNFTRISSRFSLRRKHPILNKVRAHRGVDYAAPNGTPIKATGDGTVTSLGRNGGLGKAIILRHGGQYSTVYAHLSRYKRGIKTGTRVKQGQIIGYVGMTGLASGPHLHYEFRVNGVHRNPLKIKLPKAKGIPAKTKSHFMTQIEPLLAELDSIQVNINPITRNSDNNSKNAVIAMQDNTHTEISD